MKRREFLKLGAGLAGAALLPKKGLWDSIERSIRRPNVLIVVCDQLRAKALSFYGNPDCETPNLDRLAAEGAVIQTAVSPTPVCTPWRGSFMSGLHPRTLALRYDMGWQGWNNHRLPDKLPTLGKVLRDAGYSTGYIGKWHLFGGREWSQGTPEYQGWVPSEARHGWEWWSLTFIGRFFIHRISLRTARV